MIEIVHGLRVCLTDAIEQMQTVEILNPLHRRTIASWCMFVTLTAEIALLRVANNHFEGTFHGTIFVLGYLHRQYAVDVWRNRSDIAFLPQQAEHRFLK